MSESPLDKGSYSESAPGFIRFFVRHPNASNLIMILMVIFGLVAISRINTQFFPTIDVPSITATFNWPGASAEDVEANILKTVEPELRFIDDVKKMDSYAREGAATIILEFENGADMQKALSDVESEVARITTFPSDMEDPIISRAIFYETIGRITLSGSFPEAALREFARDIRDGLIARGISKVEFVGMRDREIVADIPEWQLRRLDLTVGDIAERMRASSEDLPAGILSGDVERQVRSLAEAETAAAFGAIEIVARSTGEKVRLRDIGRVAEEFDDDEPIGVVREGIAIQLDVQRAANADTLESTEILRSYIEEIRPTLPPTLNVKISNLASERLQERIDLLLYNGLTGLALVLIILFIFLNARIAFWVAVGIPVAMLASLGFMWATGQSVNMLSLFALIMTLGIVVDDAIVVGEHTATRLEMGDTPIEAAERGAGRMVWPVVAAILTTQAAFFPLFFVQDILGQIMAALPLVVIAVLTASLVECLVILPGHLRHSADHVAKKPSWFRRNFDAGFARFRDGPMHAVATAAVHWRYTTVALAVASLIITIGLLSGGRLGFQFFPSPESETIDARITLAPGTPRETALKHLTAIEDALRQVEAELGGGEAVIRDVFSVLGQSGRNQGDEFANITAELVPSEERSVRTSALMSGWREALPDIAGIERVAIVAQRPGPPGRDLDIELSDAEPAVLKAAALEVRDLLSSFPGVSSIDDDLPFGKPEIILELTARGRALGFDGEMVGRQVRNNIEGAIARRFAQGEDEVTVRVRTETEGSGRAALAQMTLFAPGGEQVPLSEVVSIREKRGFSIIQRRDGVPTVSVTADVDFEVTDNTEIVRALSEGPLPEIAQRYNIDFDFAGREEERQQSFADLRFGALLALGIIYVILAWVFADFARPIAVMAIVPFGVVGAFLGHMIMGFDLTILSFFGLLGLTGILVNDSIILVARINERLAMGESLADASVGASKDRLRAVLLTSLTTIGGLFPLMFEKSLQAQFLLPMAITIVFGLAVATLFVLFLVPAIITIGGDMGRFFRALWRKPDRGTVSRPLPAE